MAWGNRVHSELKPSEQPSRYLLQVYWTLIRNGDEYGNLHLSQGVQEILRVCMNPRETMKLQSISLWNLSNASQRLSKMASFQTSFLRTKSISLQHWDLIMPSDMHSTEKRNNLCIGRASSSLHDELLFLRDTVFQKVVHCASYAQCFCT